MSEDPRTNIDQPRPSQIEEEEIPEARLSLQRQTEIYNDFKISVRNANFEKVQEILNQYQREMDLVNRIDPQSRQISSYIAAVIPDEDQALRMLQILLDHGVNLRFKDHMKQSIMFYIARDGKAKVLEFVYPHGLEINESDIYQQTPLYYAARDNRLDFVRKLIEFGCDLNHVDGLSSQTALFYAAREGNIEMCKMLMENGCKPQHQDSSRKTAIFYAKKSQKKEVVDLINHYLSKTKDDKKEPEQIKKKKKDKDTVPKQSYKLVYTDEQGNQKELNEEDFTVFQKQYPDIARMLLNADETIDEEMIQQIKEEESWEKLAKKVLGQLWRAKGAYFFTSPVDPKKYGIDDYFEIVKKPMDFGTIKNKLHQNVYRTCTEFVQDVEQVFQNCLLYNGTDTEVGAVGVQIHEEFKQLKSAYNLNKFLKGGD